MIEHVPTAAIRPTGEVHPVADLFPMLPDDELAELAQDILFHGLQQPIVLDDAGVLIDGRNRLAACQMVEVEPTYVSLNGTDPVTYILSANVNRRHMTKGQRAMAVAMARFATNQTSREIANITGVSQSRIAYAETVRQYAPDLTEQVLAGALSLDAAYEQARSRKASSESDEARFAKLQADDSDLASLVVEERLSLNDAIRTHQEHVRQAKAEREDMTKTFVNTFSVLHGLLTVGEGMNRVARLWEPSANTMAHVEQIAHLWTAEGIRDVSRRLDMLADDVDKKGGRLG